MRKFTICLDKRYTDLSAKDRAFLCHKIRQMRKKINEKKVTRSDVINWHSICDTYGIKRFGESIEVVEVKNKNFNIEKFEV